MNGRRCYLVQAILVLLLLLLMQGSPCRAEAVGGVARKAEEREWVRMFGLSAGPGLGTLFLGGKMHHDFVFLNFYYGQFLEKTFGVGSAWEGRLMILGEATMGWEYNPGDALVVSLTPMLRYHFNTAGPFVPFLEGGYGLTWSDLRDPDLGGDFQFNGYAGGGAYWFARPHIAFSLQYRFVHYSNAGMRSPNSGVNINAFLAGVSYFF